MNRRNFIAAASAALAGIAAHSVFIKLQPPDARSPLLLRHTPRPPSLYFAGPGAVYFSIDGEVFTYLGECRETRICLTGTIDEDGRARMPGVG